MKKIKDECIDMVISNPLTGKTTWVRNIQIDEYDYYFKFNPWLFEIEEIEDEVKEVKKKKK